MDIKYKLQDFDEFNIIKGLPEQNFYNHKPKIIIDDYGHTVTIFCEMTFNKSNVIQGQFYFFVPSKQGVFDINLILPELVYQSFSRLSGYVLAKEGFSIPTLPTISQITSELGSVDVSPL